MSGCVCISFVPHCVMALLSQVFNLDDRKFQAASAIDSWCSNLACCKCTHANLQPAVCLRNWKAGLMGISRVDHRTTGTMLQLQSSNSTLRTVSDRLLLEPHGLALGATTLAQASC